jgi:hypothetical protein
LRLLLRFCLRLKISDQNIIRQSHHKVIKKLISRLTLLKDFRRSLEYFEISFDIFSAQSTFYSLLLKEWKHYIQDIINKSEIMQQDQSYIKNDLIQLKKSEMNIIIILTFTIN